MSDVVVSNLQLALERCSAAIAESYANPKPSYSINGQSVSRESFRSAMLRDMEALRQQIAAANGPVEFTTQGYV